MLSLAFLIVILSVSMMIIVMLKITMLSVVMLSSRGAV
jgi:hypothetical protein